MCGRCQLRLLIAWWSYFSPCCLSVRCLARFFHRVQSAGSTATAGTLIPTKGLASLQSSSSSRPSSRQTSCFCRPLTLSFSPSLKPTPLTRSSNAPRIHPASRHFPRIPFPSSLFLDSLLQSSPLPSTLFPNQVVPSQGPLFLAHSLKSRPPILLPIIPRPSAACMFLDKLASCLDICFACLCSCLTLPDAAAGA